MPVGQVKFTCAPSQPDDRIGCDISCIGGVGALGAASSMDGIGVADPNCIGPACKPGAITVVVGVADSAVGDDNIGGAGNAVVGSANCDDGPLGASNTG